MNNKRGWIKIVEAFIAVLLVAGVLLLVINRGYIGRSDISGKVYDAQIAVLREIELNTDLRMQILQVNLNNPIVPQDVLNKIDERMPEYLECRAAICSLEAVCPMPGEYLDEDIYAQPVAIAAEGSEYDPRQLKLFCWAG